MNKIVNINRNTAKRNKKPWFAMSRENLQLIKEVLVDRLWADVIIPESFKTWDKTIEEALKEEENKL